MAQILDIIMEHYPKSIDCINGHIGEPTEHHEEELDDDRYYRVLVMRCGHCNMPLSSDYE